MRFPKKMVKMACHQFIPQLLVSTNEEASIYVGMQADIEIQRAAKLPARHFRRLAGTGARSSLNSLLSRNSATCVSANSAGTELMLVCHRVNWLNVFKSSLVS